VPGEYTASAVEWSGLESQKSLPLRVQGKSSGMVFEEAPKDFSWTTRSWQVDGKTVTETDAMKAPQSTMELMHLHDGRIATEKWQSGRRATHVDYNGDGKPLRFQEFENEKLKKQVYKTPDGVLSSEEFYGPDGFKTEYIKHDIRPARIGRVSRHWWYKRGRPVKVIRGGKVIYDEN